MKTALVTGGCGFVGSHIVRALRQRGVETRVLALPAEATGSIDDLDVEVIRGDVLSPDDCVRAVDGRDAVFHAAAIYKAFMEDPTPMYEVNLRGTFNMLEASRRAGVERVVYTASIASLGRPEPGRIADENTAYEAWDLDFAYSRAKYHSRVLAEDFARWGMDVRVICPGLVFGPGDMGPTPSGQLIVEALKGGPPIYVEGGGSYVDVRDAAEVHVLAAERGRPGQRYIATGHNLDNHQLLLAISRVAGLERRFVKVPVRVARSVVIAMEQAARRMGKEPPLPRTFFEYSLKRCFYSNDKSIRELGASYRPIEQTLRDAMADFRLRGLVA